MRMTYTQQQDLAHRFLSLYKRIGDRLDANLEALDRAESRRFNIVATISETPMSGGDGDKMASALAAVERHIGKIEADAVKLDEVYEQVHVVVEGVCEEHHKAGMTIAYWYEAGLSPGEIAGKIDCSKRTVYDLYKKGLDIAYCLLLEGVDDEFDHRL